MYLIHEYKKDQESRLLHNWKEKLSNKEILIFHKYGKWPHLVPYIVQFLNDFLYLPST